MGIEIERKFLLKNDSWKTAVTETRLIRQGYLQSGLEKSQKSSVRIRISNKSANINIKSRELAIRRQEYEYPIPVDDARIMLESLCVGVIDKIRHHVKHAGVLWEVDEFSGQNAGLIVAEIELESEDDHFQRPSWLGKEVSDDARYYNVNLIQHPYSQW